MRNDLVIPVSTILSFLLVLTRLSAIFIFVPIPGTQSGPGIARVFLCLSLTFALAPQWPTIPNTTALSDVVMWLLSEVALGLTAGLAVSFISEAFLFGAQVLSIQAGYGYASIIDPMTQADSGVLLVVAQTLAGLMFFALGLEGHILRALAHSLEVYPPGSYAITPGIAEEVLKLAGSVLNIGLRLALPIAGLMLLIDLVLAILGRLHSQIQLVHLSFPIKLLLCLFVMASMLIVARPIYESAASSVLVFVQKLLWARR